MFKAKAWNQPPTIHPDRRTAQLAQLEAKATRRRPALELLPALRLELSLLRPLRDWPYFGHFCGTKGREKAARISARPHGRAA
ncbi:uncharacterized protein PpBr36_10976 [Pyricularia pennisetigena]|uniref:uncharacterized protein n=1 Tax=Pyricularia pennisetigena TaxID=1578925 RepID=UPI001150B974|nr:uncharacterized protein PpBr36_10976 [Pyricularia pennisetigena]TLS20818.1 hypothetical protein PpBr36_10976 [Pyricularia pennisetigena]